MHRKPRLMLRVLLIVAALPLATACQGEGVGTDLGAASAAGAPSVAAPAPIGARVAARFEGILRQTASVRTLARQGDSPALWSGTRVLVDQGIALIRARMPHDLKRPDVLRFQAARSAFGDALKEVTYARDARDALALDRALQRLDGTTRRWSDAYLGLAPESSI